jgi:NADH-quinone oxidoreductase subunit G
VQPKPVAANALVRIPEVPIYAGDSVLRRATALNQTVHAVSNASISLHPNDAAQRGLSEGDNANVSDGHNRIELPVIVDASVAVGAVRVPMAVANAATLMLGTLEVARA